MKDIKHTKDTVSSKPISYFLLYCCLKCIKIKLYEHKNCNKMIGFRPKIKIDQELEEFFIFSLWVNTIPHNPEPKCSLQISENWSKIIQQTCCNHRKIIKSNRLNKKKNQEKWWAYSIERIQFINTIDVSINYFLQCRFLV